MKQYLPFVVILVLISVLFSVPNWGEGHYLAKMTEEINIFKKPTISVLNFGDVMFDRGVRNIIENRGRDPFEHIKKDLDLLKGYDVFIVNLEGPIVEMDRSLCQQKEFNFQFAKDTTERLKSIGVNMVNIANNHTYDCLRQGFLSTKQNLEKSGIDFIGDGELEKSFVVKEIDGRKVAFVGIDETVQSIPLVSFYQLIERLDAENYLVVINIHWGVEYENTANQNQVNIAHKLIDSGADVVFGHHPHVIQNIEIYEGQVIFYSLGNFVFDQGFRETKFGLGVGAEFNDNKATFTLFPFEIKVFAPELMKGEEGKIFCDKLLKEVSHNGCKFEVPTVI